MTELESKCWEYLQAIKDIEEFSGMGIYGIENQRVAIHEELCRLSGLSRDDMYDLTNNAHLFESGTSLYFAIKKKMK